MTMPGGGGLTGAVIGQAVVEITADKSKLDKGLKDSKGGLEAWGREATKTGAVLTGALTAPITAFGLKSLQVGAQFESGMNKVRAVTGATGDDFDSLSGQAKELGRTTQFSATQAADAMGFLGMAGFSTNEIMAAMPSTLQLAAAGAMDLGRAADITSNILTGYGLEVEELGHANDVLVKALTSANVDLSQLGDAFKYVGPVAKGAGIRFEEAAAAIAMMGNAGIQGSMAGTSLRGAITRLLNPTAQVSGAMNRLGLNVKDTEGNLVSIEEIVRQLEVSGASTADMMMIFGQRAGPAMAALVEQGSEALANMTEELANSGGIAERVATIQMEGLSGAMLRLKSAWEGVLIAFAESGFLDMAAQGAEKLAGFLTKLAETNPELMKMIGIIGGIVAAAGPLLVTLGGAALALSALSGPILLVAAGATAVAIAFGLLAVDADKLPGPLGNVVRVMQSLSEYAPLVAAGIGLVFASMVASKAAMFISTLVAVNTGMQTVDASSRMLARNLPARMAAAFMTPMGAMLAVSAALIAVDFGLRKLTGDGLIENVTKLFKGIDYHAEAAAKKLQELEDRAKLLGRALTSNEIGLDLKGLISELEYLEKQLEKPFDPSKQQHAEWIASAGLVRIEIEKLGGDARALAEYMRENGASAGELVTQYDRLPPALQESFAKGAELQRQIRLLELANKDAAKETRDLAFNTSDLAGRLKTEMVPAATEAAEAQDVLWQAIVELAGEGEDAYKDLLKAAEDSYNGIVSSVQSLLPAVDESHEKWVERLQKTAADHANFQANISTIYDALTAAGVAMPEQITAAIAEKGPEYAANFAQWFAEDPEAALEGLKQVAPILTGDTVDAVLTEAWKLPEGMTPIMALYVSEALSGLGELSVQGVPVTEMSIGEILAILADPNKLAQFAAAGEALGLGVVGGIANGLRNATARANIEAIANEIKGGLTTEFNYQFEMRSPSRYMAREVGLPIIEGVAMGMRDGVPIVMSAVDAFTAETKKKFIAWQIELQRNLNEGITMTGEEIWSLLMNIKDSILNSGLDDAGKIAATGMIDGWLEGLSEGAGVANAELDKFLRDLATKAAAGIAAVSDIINGGEIGNDPNNPSFNVLDPFARRGREFIGQFMTPSGLVDAYSSMGGTGYYGEDGAFRYHDFGVGDGAQYTDGGSAFNITVNAAPGMNEQQVAKLVKHEVEEIQREQYTYGAQRWGVA